MNSAVKMKEDARRLGRVRYRRLHFLYIDIAALVVITTLIWFGFIVNRKERVDASITPRLYVTMVEDVDDGDAVLNSPELFAFGSSVGFSRMVTKLDSRAVYLVPAFLSGERAVENRVLDAGISRSPELPEMPKFIFAETGLNAGVKTVPEKRIAPRVVVESSGALKEYESVIVDFLSGIFVERNVPDGALKIHLRFSSAGVPYSIFFEPNGMQHSFISDIRSGLMRLRLPSECSGWISVEWRFFDLISDAEHDKFKL